MAIPVIFEGTDKSGKTTTLTALRKIRNTWAIYIRPKQVKDTKPVDDWADACAIDLTTISDMQQLNTKYAIVDRIPHFSEVAYGKVVDNVPHLENPLNLAMWKDIDTTLVKSGAILVYCHSAPRVIEARWDREPDPYMKREHIGPLQQVYAQILEMSGVARIMINTGVCSPDHAAVQVIKFAEKVARNYEIRGDRPYRAVGSVLYYYGVPSGTYPSGAE